MICGMQEIRSLILTAIGSRRNLQEAISQHLRIESIEDPYTLFNDFYEDIPTTDLCMGLDLNHQLLVVNAMCIYMECGTVNAREKSKYEKLFEDLKDETFRNEFMAKRGNSDEQAK